MSDLHDIRLSIQRARAELTEALEREALRAGADAAALVENRIVTKGEGPDGGKLSPYSNTEVPAFFFFGRSRNAAGEQAVRRKSKARQPVSYRQFRELNGLNTSAKNLEFTGAMWRGFGVKGIRILRPGLIEVEIGGTNQYSETLLGYHSQRENQEITAPSGQELAQIEAALKLRINDIIGKI